MIDIEAILSLFINIYLIINFCLIIVPFILIKVFAKKNNKEQEKHYKNMISCIKFLFYYSRIITILMILMIINICLDNEEIIFWVQNYIPFQNELQVCFFLMPFVLLVLLILSFILYLTNRKCNNENAKEYKKYTLLLLFSSLISFLIYIVCIYILMMIMISKV